MGSTDTLAAATDDNGEVGYELRTAGDKGEGIYALKSFKRGDIVMVGRITQTLEKNDHWAFQTGRNTFVRQAGLLYKVNHSCSPNLGFRDNETNAHDFVAFKDIAPGDELVADYAMGCYTTEFVPQCMCGNESCRKRITGWEELPVEKKLEYKGFIANYIVEIELEKEKQKNANNLK